MENRSRDLTICCSLVASLCACPTAHAQENAASFVTFSLGSYNWIRIEVPSTTDQYYVLYYRRESGDTEIPVAMHFGAAGRTTLTEQLAIGSPNGRYRVQPYRFDQPGDAGW